MSQGRKIYSAISIFMMMFIFAIIENTKGVLIPQIKEQFGINSTQVSFMLTSGSIFYILGTFFIGKISEKTGQKNSEILGILIMMASCLTISFSPNYFVFLLGMMGFNIALSINGVVSNVIISVMFLPIAHIVIGMLHFMYGVGAMIGQKGTGIVIENGFTFRNLYLWLIVLLVILLILVVTSKYPEPEIHEEEIPVNTNILKNPVIILFALSIGFYVFAEQGLAVWLVDYLKSVYSMTENNSSTYMATFFLLLAIGRLIGGFVVRKVGEFKTLFICITTGFLLIITSIIIGPKGLFLISLAGFFYSIVYPTVVVLISKNFKNRISYITGLILTFSSIINMLMNQLMGTLTDFVGYKTTIFLIPLSAVVSITMLFLLKNKIEAKRFG